MDADGPVQLLLGRAALHGCAEALSHLSSVWTQVVEANDSALRRASATAEKRHLSDTRLQRKGSFLLGTEEKQSYAVQLVADDLGVAFVVISARHSELQGPELCVEHLNNKTKRNNTRHFNQIKIKKNKTKQITSVKMKLR